jgi:hypothetical protein
VNTLVERLTGNDSIGDPGTVLQEARRQRHAQDERRHGERLSGDGK